MGEQYEDFSPSTKQVQTVSPVILLSATMVALLPPGVQIILLPQQLSCGSVKAGHLVFMLQQKLCETGFYTVRDHQSY
jgi:hypothetical protein